MSNCFNSVLPAFGARCKLSDVRFRISGKKADRQNLCKLW